MKRQPIIIQLWVIEEMAIERIKKQFVKEATEQGIEKGEEKAFEVVKNLLTANKFTIAEIAKFANVKKAFVLKVKESL